MPGTKIYYISGARRNGVGTVYFDGQPITADSTPVYDTWGPNWLTGYWQCGEWMEWHKQLEKKWGRAQANAIWYAAWMQQSFAAGPQNCKWDKTFTNYLVAVGLLDPKEWAMILPNIVSNTGEVIVNITDAAAGVSRWIKLAAGVAVIGAGVWAYNKYVK
jgi:hypothetical protein